MIDVGKTLLTKEELALRLKVSVSCINSWIQQEKLLPIKIGRRALFPIDTQVPTKETKTKGNQLPD
jgi:hypothetical protein